MARLTRQRILIDKPDPPIALCDAADRGKLVLFVGAGISRLAGSPDWSEFSARILDWLQQGKLIDYAERDLLQTLPLKTRLSISHGIWTRAERKPSASDFRDMLITKDSKLRARGKDIYRDLCGMSRYVVTTNYDDWPDIDWTRGDTTTPTSGSDDVLTPLERTIACKPSDIKLSNLQREHVIHLHGSMKIPESMIITTSQYLLHYANDRGKDQNPVTTFLHHLFRQNEWHVLFIGYGLEEMEILEYVLQKSSVYGHDNAQESEPQHTMLRGFFKHEQHLIRHLSDYYREHCGINLLPFSLDQAGHQQLQTIVHSWTKSVRAHRTPPLERRMVLEKLLND